MRKSVLLLLPLVLLGCSSTPQQRIAEAHTNCGAYGFQPGTSEYAQCMMYQDTVIQQQDEAQRAKRAAFGAALLNSGQPATTCQTQGFYSLGRPMATTTCR